MFGSKDPCGVLSGLVTIWVYLCLEEPMKKIILLVLAICLPLLATAGTKIKINPAQVAQDIEKRGGISNILKNVQKDLETLRGMEPYQRNAKRVPDLLPNLSLLGYTSPKYLPLIEETYQLFSKNSSSAYFEALAARSALRHGQYDFLNRFQDKYGGHGDFWQYVRTLMREYGALTTSHKTLEMSMGEGSIQETRREDVQYALSGQPNKDPLGATLDKFDGHKYTRAWLPEPGSPEDDFLAERARQQASKPLSYIEPTEIMLLELRDTLDKLKNIPQEDVLELSLYRDAQLPAAHKHAVITTFLKRYDSITENIISQLEIFENNLQKYIDNPKRFSYEKNQKTVDQLREQAYAARADLVAFIQYNMTGGTPLQHDLYTTLSDLADYYRFLQDYKVDVPAEFRGEYGLSGTFTPSYVRRPARTDTWAERFLLDDAPAEYSTEKISNLSEQQVRDLAVSLKKQLDDFSLSQSNTQNVPSMKTFAYNSMIGDPSKVFIAMRDYYPQEKSIMKEQRYIGYVSALAYMRELLLQDKALIELDASGAHPLPDGTFARQRLGNVQRIREWLFKKLKGLYDPSEVDFPSLILLREVEDYWRAVADYNSSIENATDFH